MSVIRDAFDVIQTTANPYPESVHKTPMPISQVQHGKVVQKIVDINSFSITTIIFLYFFSASR